MKYQFLRPSMLVVFMSFRENMHFKNEGHQFLYDYWLAKKGDRKAPSRKDIDPIDFFHLLPTILMYDVLRDPLDFKMRLHGTLLVKIAGEDYTGMMFKDIFRSDKIDILRAECEDVCNNITPAYSEYDGSWMNKDYVQYDRLLLPLSSDGNTVDIILGCVLFMRQSLD